MLLVSIRAGYWLGVAPLWPPHRRGFKGWPCHPFGFV